MLIVTLIYLGLQLYTSNSLIPFLAFFFFYIVEHFINILFFFNYLQKLSVDNNNINIYCQKNNYKYFKILYKFWLDKKKIYINKE